MSTLANIDMEYEQERQRLAGDPRDGALKNRMLQKCTAAIRRGGVPMWSS